MLVPRGSEVVDAILISPGEVSREVLWIDVGVWKGLCDTLSMLKRGCVCVVCVERDSKRLCQLMRVADYLWSRCLELTSRDAAWPLPRVRLQSGEQHSQAHKNNLYSHNFVRRRRHCHVTISIFGKVGRRG